jgi:hypothetical protein
MLQKICLAKFISLKGRDDWPKQLEKAEEKKPADRIIIDDYILLFPTTIQNM